jgi:1,2-diacylglycerol 3-alpha-glucosyltransferase
MIIATCFTNFGPYHLARLRALAARLQARGDCLIAYEMAGSERTYPWQRQRADEPFDWITLFPDRPLETLTGFHCTRAMIQLLDRDQPDVIGVGGYARPESMAAARWARRNGIPSVLMSESQAIDRPRTWWKESIKRRRLCLFDAALVGGSSHRDYLVELGMPANHITVGYNAVDNTFYRNQSDAWRDREDWQGVPQNPFFLSVCRFVPEKNLIRLIEAFVLYREQECLTQSWDLVLCGDGPQVSLIEETIGRSGHSEAIHRPGFIQADALCRWYAHAGAFVLPSLSEPWGLVVNEAASTGLPLLVSERAGCVATLVPYPEGSTGARFNPLDVEEIAQRLTWLARLPLHERLAMGQRAVEVVSRWGTDRFAQGMLEAIDLAIQYPRAVKSRLLQQAR